MVFLVGTSYLAENLAAYAAVDWASLTAPHSYLPLSALYALAGALVLGLLGGRSRDATFARVHVVALVTLAVAWIAILLLGSPGNVLMMASAIVVIGDGVACYAVRPRVSAAQAT